MPAAEAFLDTNVLVYAISKADPAKQSIALGIVSRALAERSAVISFQVVQECLNVATGKFESTLRGSARVWLEDYLMPLCAVLPSQSLYLRAIDVKARYQFSFYDSLIVATALQAQVRTLMTEDLQHGQIIDGLQVINPFRL